MALALPDIGICDEPYRERVLGLIDPRHRFLYQLVDFHGLWFPDDNPEALTTGEIIGYMERQLRVPSQEHVMLLQGAWIDEHKHHMGNCLDRYVPDEEAERDFTKDKKEEYFGLTGRDRLNLLYAEKYLYPFLSQASSNDPRVEWALNRIWALNEIYHQVGSDFDVRRLFSESELEELSIAA